MIRSFPGSDAAKLAQITLSLPLYITVGMKNVMILCSALFEPDAGAAYSFEIVQSYFYQSKKYSFNTYVKAIGMLPLVDRNFTGIVPLNWCFCHVSTTLACPT